jgi:hypothetical protein
MKQTAVEWLFEEFTKINHLTEDEFYMKFQQAKEMEKEQMINFAKTLPIKTRLLQEGGTTYMIGDAELHYNETFKQEQ